MTHLQEDERDMIEFILPLHYKDIFENNITLIDKELLFYAFHFPHMESGEKTGTIRYRPGKIRLPFGSKLPAYETEAVEEGKKLNKKVNPRGIVTIDHVVACQLQELNEEERGFVSQEELFEGMKEYYADIMPDSLISYYAFKAYDPNPSRSEIKRLLKIVNK
jgi:hypothetical protein